MKKDTKYLYKSKERCKIYRKRILDISQKVSALHVGGSFSCVEIMDYIFHFLMSDRKEINNFIMSKGHASIIHYVILEYLKILKTSDLNNYCKPKGILGVHPDIGNPGINASTGSLGHGLSIAAGMALADKKKKIYVVISDGELQEGSTWEALMLIPSLNLKNVFLFIDNNDLQSSERISKTYKNFYPIEKKLKLFGWNSYKCNGNKISSLIEAGKKNIFNKPLAIVAETKKGYPVSFMMKDPIWHYRSPNKDEYYNSIKEIEKL